MTAVHIVDGVRTPHGRFLGGLTSKTAVELGETALGALLDRTAVDPAAVGWVGLGNAISAGLGQAPARQIAVGSDLPVGVPATTIDEASGSGLRALALGVDRIGAGRCDFAVVGGTESMSNAPYLLPDLRRGRRHGNTTAVDSMIYDALWDVTCDAHMGELTERLVDRFDIAREVQDEYAAESHRRAVEAVESGAFEDETVPVQTDDGQVAADEGPRPDTSVDALADLDPAFASDGTITAGNASDLSDGAACLLLGHEDAVAAAGLDSLARIVDYRAAYRDPGWFSMAVADAVEALLDATDLAVEDVDLFELNEAFAAQMIYVRDRLDLPRAKLNPRGGAIALGHPIGASGGILTTTLAYAMADRDVDRGVVGMSIGGGGGLAMLLERP